MKDIATNYFKRRNDNFHLIFEKINENLTNFEIPTKIPTKERAPLWMATSEIKGAVYIGSVVITKSLTKFKPEEQEIVIQLAINKVTVLSTTKQSQLGKNCPASENDPSQSVTEMH